MNNIIVFIKKYWQGLIILFLLFVLLKESFINQTVFNAPLTKQLSSYETMDAVGNAEIGFPSRQAAPVATDDERMVVQNTWLSVLVKNVVQARDNIITISENLGGYMVDSNFNSPDGADTADVTVRVPTENQEQALDEFRKLGVRVVSENWQGTDVTDEYIDLEDRLQVLEKTKTKFEAILEQASEVNDILQVQRELTSLQSQIDNLKGRQEYYQQSADLSKITVYLSTDELALPYAPSEPWRPGVVLKYAVRSLVSTGRSLGSAIIWIAVYGAVWVPIVLGVYFYRKWKRGKNIHNQN
jgi:hypothetical protein